MSQHVQRGASYVRSASRVGPWQRVVLVSYADSQQLVPGRMELYFIQAVAEAIVSVQCGRVPVRQFTQTQGLRASHQGAEFADRTFGPGSALSSQCLLQRQVSGEEIVVIEWRRLIEDLARLSISGPGP